VEDGTSATGYEIRGVSLVNDEVRLHTKRNGRGYPVAAGTAWSIPMSGWA
jgi:hypothetical protein